MNCRVRLAMLLSCACAAINGLRSAGVQVDMWLSNDGQYRYRLQASIFLQNSSRRPRQSAIKAVYVLNHASAGIPLEYVTCVLCGVAWLQRQSQQMLTPEDHQSAKSSVQRLYQSQVQQQPTEIYVEGLAATGTTAAECRGTGTSAAVPVSKNLEGFCRVC